MRLDLLNFFFHYDLDIFNTAQGQDRFPQMDNFTMLNSSQDLDILDMAFRSTTNKDREI